jgi:hypothetical protein
MGQLDFDLVAHKIALVVLGDALLGSFASFKFLPNVSWRRGAQITKEHTTKPKPILHQTNMRKGRTQNEVRRT